MLRLSGCWFKGTATEWRVSGLDRVVSGGVSRGDGGIRTYCMRYSTGGVMYREDGRSGYHRGSSSFLAPELQLKYLLEVLVWVVSSGKDNKTPRSRRSNVSRPYHATTGSATVLVGISGT